MSDASLGHATLRTRLDSSGLRTGLEQAKTETQRAAGDIVRTLRGAFSGAVAAFASSGIAQFNTFLQRSAQLAHQAEASHQLFERQLARNNESLARGRQLVQELSDRFGVANSVIEEGATLLLRAGGSLDDVERALTAAGATGAAAGIDLERAFSNMAIAVATGRSTLLDTIGVVTNLGPAVQAYANSVGKSVEELTQAELIQARVNAIYEETASEIEDVDTILAGLPLSQARVNQEWRIFRENVGEVAQQIIIPLNRGLESTLSIINSLHPELTRFGVAFVGLSLGASGLAAAFQTLRTVLPLLRAAFLPLLGPGGLIAAGAVLVGSLAFAFAGRPSSLDRSIEKAQQALAGGDANSLAGALDEIVQQVDGPVKEVFEELRDDLRETGDVGVEQMQRIATAASLIDELRAAQERVARAEAAVAASQASARSMREAGVARDASGQVMFDVENELANIRNQLYALGEAAVAPFIRFNEELGRFVNEAPAEILESVLDPEGVQAVLDDASRAVAGAMTGTSGLVNEARLELEEATAELEALKARINSAGGAGGAGDTGAGDAAPSPTGENRIAARRAELESELDALRAELEHGLITAEEFFTASSDAVRAAARDLIRLGASNEQIAATLARLEDFSLGEIYERWADHLDDEVDRLLARTMGVGRSTGTVIGPLSRADIGEIGRMRRRAEDYDRQIADSLNVIYGDSAGELARMRARARDYDRQLSEARRLFDEAYGDSDGELARFHSNMRFGAQAMARAAEEAERLARAVNRAAEADAAWAAEREEIEQRQQDLNTQRIIRDRQIERTQGLIDAASGSGDIGAIDAALEAIEQFRVRFGDAWAEMFAATERNLRQQREAIEIVNGLARAKAEEVAAYRYSGENAVAYTEQLQLQAAAIRLAAKEGISLTEAFDRLRITTEELAAAARTDGQSGGVNRRYRFNDFTQATPQERAEMAQELRDEIRQAGIDFAEEVVQAADGFVSVIASIQRGDVAGAISGLGSTVGGLFSAFGQIGGPLSALGPYGALISAGAGLLGGLVSLFGGGNRDASEATRAAGATARSVPAIELNLVINQDLHVQSLTDPASRGAISGLLDETVRRLEAAITQNIVPRIQALEARAA